MKKILLILGSLLLLNAIYLLFKTNSHMGIAVQVFIAVAFILYAFILKKIKKSIHIIIGCFCLLPLLFMSFLAVYGNIDNADYGEDVVIVLGAGIHGEKVSATLAKRLDEAVTYYGKNPDAVIIVCGGQGPQEDITEALAMERYLLSKGIPVDSIIKEEQSTSTYENFVNAKKILDEHFPQGFTAVLITNDFHIFRAEKTADNAGISARHIGVNTVWYTVPSNYLREMLAIIKTWLL